MLNTGALQGEDCVMQISVHQFLEWNLWMISTRSSFLVHFAVKSIWNIWVRVKMKDKDEISIWNIWMWIKWEINFRNSYGPLSIGLNPWMAMGVFVKYFSVVFSELFRVRDKQRVWFSSFSVFCSPSCSDLVKSSVCVCRGGSPSTEGSPHSWLLGA